VIEFQAKLSLLEGQHDAGKTHENIKTIRPLKDGVIADFDASEKMISMFIKSIPALKKENVYSLYEW
jgi:actin-like ATPase involved in cell morphogenesis